MFEKTKKPNGDSMTDDKMKVSTSTASIGPAVKINGRINSDEDLAIEGFVDSCFPKHESRLSLGISQAKTVPG